MFIVLTLIGGTRKVWINPNLIEYIDEMSSPLLGEGKYCRNIRTYSGDELRVNESIEEIIDKIKNLEETK